MYNRPYFTPWVNPKKIVVNIPDVQPPLEPLPKHTYWWFEYGDEPWFKDYPEAKAEKVRVVRRCTQYSTELGWYEIEHSDGYRETASYYKLFRENPEQPIEITLKTDEGEFMQQLTIPPSNDEYPEVIIWGNRVFSRIYSSEYWECSYYAVPDPNV
ncbi:hypothetical protein JYQ62_02130 [Nostoc sp. UHCC 0702]|nr:hypothetical protein JYQ62_02130 [Nostoc sp. UHCC 0702]